MTVGSTIEVRDPDTFEGWRRALITEAGDVLFAARFIRSTETTWLYNNDSGRTWRDG